MKIGTSGVPPDNELHARKGFFLPHWELHGATYHVVFCLRDGLPKKVIQDFIAERDALLAKSDLREEERHRLQYLVSNRIAKFLDAGAGKCILKQPALATVVQDALQHFHQERYLLYAWCVMPNHVHAVVHPLSDHRLPQILHSWKSFSAHKINTLMGTEGEVWHKESYDHIIRSQAAFERTIRYVLNNPAAAGLVNWRWVGSQNGETPKVQGDAE